MTSNKPIIPLFFAGVASWICYVYLAMQSQAYAQTQLFDFYLSMGTAFVLCVVLFIYYHWRKMEVPWLGLLLFAILFRVTGLWSFPVLEDDVYRYLWDGFQFVEYGSPYLQAPAAFFGSDIVPDTFQTLLDHINYPAIATVYGPVNQYVYALAYLVAPGEVWPLQVFYIAVDIALILILKGMAQSRFVLLYAWSPLVIKEFAFTVHPDLLGVFFLFLGAVLIKSKKPYLASVIFALALGVKVFAIVMIPFFLRLHIRYWLTLLLTAIVIALPFGFRNAWLPEGLSAMADGWFFNAPLYSMLWEAFDIVYVKRFLLVLFAIFWIGVWGQWMWQGKEHQLPRGDCVYLVFFMFIPVLNPWYVVWMLPFAVVYPSTWAWVMSFAVLLSYISGINLHEGNYDLYQQPIWAMSLEFGLIVLALIYSVMRGRLLKL